MRKESGFTIAELMVVLAIGAILMAMAVPAARNFIQSARLTTTTNELVLSVNIARTEAAKRNVPVYLSALPSTDPANEWGEGWRVWIDGDDDEFFDEGDALSGDKELHLADPLDREFTLNSLAGVTMYRYRPSGQVSKLLPSGWSDTTDTLHLCDGREGSTDRELTLNAIGRLTVKTDALCP